MECGRAILIRRTRFSDTSLVTGWLTEEHGRIKAMAKGALKPGSSFAGAVDLFHECEIAFLPGKRSDLGTLTEATLLRPHPGLTVEPPRLQAACYFAELVECLTETGHPVNGLHGLFQRALGYLESRTPEARAIHHFEKELAQLLGLGGDASALHQLCGRLPASRDPLLAALARPRR